MADLRPLGPRLLLKAPPAPEKIGLLWIPDQAKEQFTVCQAEVLARGPQVSDARLQPGCRVIAKRFGGVKQPDGTWLVYERDVLAIVRRPN